MTAAFHTELKPFILMEPESPVSSREELDVLCTPYAPLLRQVLLGNCFKASIHYEQATFLFYHGCLMGRIFYEGECYALPPIERKNDVLTWRMKSEGDKFSQYEFLALPQELLLFFFNLLKHTFQYEPIRLPSHHPILTQILTHIEWPTLTEEAA